ncbi:succinate-semialdehyde dehydrogenase [Flavobacterium akiainvivens]|uniref:Succinate-semialdehyde dehydrogenase n=1 Tax=Flavobacterium akiainvivens TaxID=1202724 RepID=A0A0M8M9F7_9FLAO|nr:aldehyde dehydrogenase family protein [Flavobacterium akiainvivens]KOS05295.1 succinate-semialdehyde dehydrogenase [Flavobacterium akiainvivens]SFQ76210.1 succinate-semialdehyde dehydrogenase / glutarate-semialdehyde dehydrogenase [Flavobacterium akiainvivens]
MTQINQQNKDAVVTAAPGYQTLNPATGELLKEFNTLTDAEAEQLLSNAHEAYLKWRKVPVEERIEIFRKFADLMDENIDRFANQITLEMGKPLSEAKMESGLPGMIFRYFADNALEMLTERDINVEGFTRVYSRLEPIGVTLAIEPWNGPLYQSMRAAAPNLMLGNAVIMKPAEIVAGSTLMMDEIFEKAGFPSKIYQSALVSREQVTSFIADSRVRAVALTGSDRAGSIIGEQAGRHIKPVVLELGGSDAFIALDSSNPVAVAAEASACRLFGIGQSCMSPKRAIVTEKISEAFIKEYIKAFENQKVGDPFDPETTTGPLSSIAAADNLHAQYQDAVDKGAKVLVEGGRVAGTGAFFKPAVLSGITPNMRLYHEEAFGPLGMIYVVPDAEAAITLANATKYGLGGTVFSEDLDEAKYVAESIDTGMVGINRYMGAPLNVPFGGTKASGVGRELGSNAMDAFANLKTYSIL